MPSKESMSYHDKVKMDHTLKLREILKAYPPFVKDYFRAIEPNTSVRTRISYAYDLGVFFHFLTENNPALHEDIKDITLNDLDQLKPQDIEEYLEYLKYYTSSDGQTHMNDERGLFRKLSSLRSFYLYFIKRELLHNNPTQVVDMPKLHKKEIIRLDADEVADLLDYVEHGGDQMSPQKKRYFEKNKVRNLAIFTLFLGTGIRVSECVGLDITDIDFKNNRIKILRKGGKEDFVYFGDEVRDALSRYLSEERNQITPCPGHENALFLSIQKKRMSIRAFENLVTDYASHITTLKHITPHKLRSTYGTNLYRETNDIYLVAEVLGHNDVNTTKKHYAALDEDRKRRAANAVHLRND